MTTIKKIIAALLVTSMVIGLCACKEETTANASGDTSDLSMYVGLGVTGSEYYDRLHDAVLEKLGIDIKFVYTRTLDTTNSMVSRLKNYDLPADIIVTASFSPADAQKNSLLDLAAYTNVPDLFTMSKLSELSVDGAIYQLPFATRLIGIEYNKTLLNKLELKLPNNFDEMLALKDKVEAAGYQFAICGGAATGHGFNYLMHLMGADYLSGPEGAKWLSDFLEGKTDASEFAERAQYFKEYAEAGLFGEMVNDWNSAKAFAESDALFYYNILNDVYAEEGGDEYGTMPWLSRNGASNCFTYYDNMYLALDKKLAEPGQEEKLNKAVKVLEFMTTEEAVQLFTDIYPDGYLSTYDFSIKDDRIYSEYSDDISAGYTMPWYYNYFDSDSIVAVGQLCNEYIRGEDVRFEDIIDCLNYQNEARLKNEVSDGVYIKEEFGYEDSARLQAVAAGVSLQNAIDESGLNDEVKVALMPYINSVDELPVGVPTGVVQQKLYEGDFSFSIYSSVINQLTQYPVALTMTGKEIKEFAAEGYNIAEDFGKDSVFKYAVVTKNSIVLDDNAEYIVAIPKGSMTTSDYDDFLKDGKILLNGSDPIQGNTLTGIKKIFEENKKLAPGNYWMK